MILLKNRDRNPSFKKGEYVEINDAGNYPMELSVDGICEQETTSGKNLFDKDNYILDTWDNNYDAFQVSLKAGTYTLSSNTTMGTIKASNHIGADWSSVPFGTSEKMKEYTFTISEDYNGGVVIKLDGGLQINHTNIANYDIQLENGSIATYFEPYTGGQPSPSPEFPQPISTIENSLKITSCGKNLFDKDNVKRIYAYIQDNKTWKYYNDSYSIRIPVKPNANYVISADNSNETIFRAGVTDSSDIPVSGTNVALYSTTRYSNTNTPIYITTGANAKYIVIQVAEDSANDTFNTMQLEQGSIATLYEPYQGSSLNIAIPSNEFVGKLNDTYKDTLNVVYKEDGHYHLILNKMVGKVVLDGSEDIKDNWQNYDTPDYIQFYLPSSFLNNNYIDNKAKNCKCNNFISPGDSVWNYNNEGFAINKDIIYTLQFKLSKQRIKTIDDFKSWLSTHNTEVYYPLETPYTVDLGVVDTLLSYDEITNVFTDSDLYPVINVKYYKDFEFDKILRSGYNIDEQEYEIAKKQMANGKRKRILSSYDDCIIKINLGLLDNKTYQEYKEQLDDGEFHYWSYKYNQYKKANFILTKPSITTEYAYDDDIGINDMEIILEKSSDIE